VRVEASDDCENPRGGRLVWQAIPAADHYEVEEAMPALSWTADPGTWDFSHGRRTVVREPQTRHHRLDLDDWRVRAVGADGRTGPWTVGVYVCGEE
jgi:hypothetical protein